MERGTLYQLRNLINCGTGRNNELADAMSQGNLALLFAQAPPPPPGARKPPGGAAARLDVTSLVLLVQDLFSAGLAQAMQRVYRSGGKQYLEFCSSINVTPIPVSERVLSLFVAFLYKEGLSAGTVKSYLAATRHLQISLGLGDPSMGSMPQLEYVLKGMKKKTAGPRAGSRLQITPHVLRKLWLVWQALPNSINVVGRIMYMLFWLPSFGRGGSPIR